MSFKFDIINLNKKMKQVRSARLNNNYISDLRIKLVPLWHYQHRKVAFTSSYRIRVGGFGRKKKLFSSG